MKKALITGITGQDGSYLAEFLLEKGYEVHGITRRASLANTARIEHIMDKITLHDGDLSDSSSLIRIINIVQRMKFTIWLRSLMYRFLLMFRSIPAMWMLLVFFVFWKHAAFLALPKRQKFTRHLLLNCMEK